MSWFQSILSRIISLHIVAIAATSVFLPLALFFLLQSQATELQHRALQENADTISRYLEQAPDGGWRLNLPGSIQKLFSEAYGRYGYTVFDEQGRVLFSSFKDNKPVFNTNGANPSAVFFESGDGASAVSGATVPKMVDGHEFWIQVIQDLAHRDVLIDDIVREFFHRVGWITLPVLLFLLIIDVGIIRRALSPLIEASERAKSIGPSRTDVRLPSKGMPIEVLPLVKTVNEALERLERGFQMQRDFTADAAHELRTPLAILRARVETIGDKRATAELLRDIDGMTRIVSQLLDIAELESFVVDPGEVSDLKAICEEVAEFIAPLALQNGKQIALSAPETNVWIAGNAGALFRAVRNIAENALRYTPKGGGVEIEVTADGAVAVTDEGPGIPPEDRELVFRRFWRKDRRLAGGAGLGLSIVQRIVDAHGGTIVVSDGPKGGARFTVQLRKARRPEVGHSRASHAAQRTEPHPQAAE
jgi:signal transduction histidine kinase